MPWARPTLAELAARVRADVRSRLPGTDPLLRRSVTGALATVLAGLSHELHGYLGWIARQALPDTADAAELDRWAGIWGIARAPAVAATGSVRVTGSAGTVVPAGTLWRRGDGVQYRSTAPATLGAAATAIPVQAATAGRAGDAEAGTLVTLPTPVAGVVSQATVEATGGVDRETDAGLRARTLLRIRTPPRGGAADDYEVWARAGHADVTRAWARTSAAALGAVTVYLMTDGASTTGIPSAGVVAAVDAYIATRRPVTAQVTVAAPAPVPLAVTIAGIAPDTVAVRAAVAAELADLVRRESEPGGTIRLSHVREAISGAAGEVDHRLVAPTADVTHTAAQIAVPGDVTWQ